MKWPLVNPLTPKASWATENIPDKASVPVISFTKVVPEAISLKFLRSLKVIFY